MFRYATVGVCSGFDMVSFLHGKKMGVGNVYTRLEWKIHIDVFRICYNQIYLWIFI